MQQMHENWGGSVVSVRCLVFIERLRCLELLEHPMVDSFVCLVWGNEAGLKQLSWLPGKKRKIKRKRKG